MSCAELNVQRLLQYVDVDLMLTSLLIIADGSLPVRHRLSFVTLELQSQLRVQPRHHSGAARIGREIRELI